MPITDLTHLPPSFLRCPQSLPMDISATTSGRRWREPPGLPRRNGSRGRAKQHRGMPQASAPEGTALVAARPLSITAAQIRRRVRGFFSSVSGPVAQGWRFSRPAAFPIWLSAPLLCGAGLPEEIRDSHRRRFGQREIRHRHRTRSRLAGPAGGGWSRPGAGIASLHVRRDSLRQ